MTTVSAIRAGIAANLAEIPGLRTAATVPDSPNPPIAMVFPDGIVFDTTFARGMDEYRYTVLVLVGRADERSAQNRLDSFCNPSGEYSVKQALEADKTLGGAAFDLRVQEMRNYGQTPVGEVTYLSAEWSVVVYAQ